MGGRKNYDSDKTSHVRAHYAYTHIANNELCFQFHITHYDITVEAAARYAHYLCIGASLYIHSDSAQAWTKASGDTSRDLRSEPAAKTRTNAEKMSQNESGTTYQYIAVNLNGAEKVS